MRWERSGAAFTDRQYSRAHVWSFDGGVEVAAYASPLNVRAPFSTAHAVDPEEAYVASIASCHMLFFLDFAAQAGLVVDRYVDAASATMGTNARGNTYVQTVILAPRISFAPTSVPSPATVHALHERSHDACFIANSVLTEIIVQPAEPDALA